MVSQIDQDFIVSVTLRFRYSFTSQKPPSLTWEKMSEPAPVAIASSSGETPGVCSAMGATIPAAVVMATVAEPVARRMRAARVHASKQQRQVPLHGDLNHGVRDAAVLQDAPESSARADQQGDRCGRREALIAEAQNRLFA